MTTDEVQLLFTDVLAQHQIPPGIDRRSRYIREAGLAKMAAWKFLDEPAFGWDIALNLAASGQTSSLADRPAYQWVVAAQRYCRALPDCLPDDRQVADFRRALVIHRTPSRWRFYLKAALLAPDSTAATVAQAFDLDQPVVEAFADLFFNVLDRRESDYRLMALMADIQHQPVDLTELLVAALDGSLDRVLQLFRADQDVLAA